MITPLLKNNNLIFKNILIMNFKIIYTKMYQSTLENVLLKKKTNNKEHIINS